jgi:hypothetical protein
MSDKSADLFSLSHGAFRYADREKILSEAARREAGGEAWPDIVRDFHTSQHWGFEVLPMGHPETKPPVTESDKNAREVRAFFWTAFQSLLILKAFVLYFGLNYAIHHDDASGSFYGWGLGISVAFSAGSLIFFAIRKSRSRSFT